MHLVVVILVGVNWSQFVFKVHVGFALAWEDGLIVMLSLHFVSSIISSMFSDEIARSGRRIDEDCRRR